MANKVNKGRNQHSRCIKSRLSTIRLSKQKTAGQKIADESLLNWLMATGSLTAMLEAKAGQPLKVVRRYEGWRPLSFSQKQQLGMVGQSLNRPMMAWVREVLLYGNASEPWVAAQSIFPYPCLQGDAKRLKNLKNTPIGYVLFKRQRKLASSRFVQLTEQGWQRQTCYDWHGRTILIAETFLPAFG